MKKELLKNIVLALALSVISCTAYAQAEPGAIEKSKVSEEIQTQVPEDGEFLPIEEVEDVDTKIADFLAQKGWSEGIEGNYTKDGRVLWVTVGTAQISASPKDKNYIASRVNAYNIALLSAKAKMARFLGDKITTKGGVSITGDVDDEIAREKAEQAEKENILIRKIKLLIGKKIDELFEKHGVDLSSLADEEKKAVLNSVAYKNAITSSCCQFVQGIVAYKTFEHTEKNKKGRVGVVAIWTERLNEMAKIMTDGGDLPAGISKKPIREQVPTDLSTLLASFGVKQLLDEKGNYVLVSFGQAGVKSNSGVSLEIAKKEAENYARGYIRNFAGEDVCISNGNFDNEIYEEFVDEADEENILNVFQEKIESVAKELEIRGISTLKTVKVKHPKTGKNVCIAVCTWSPKSKSLAEEFGAKMQSGYKSKPTKKETKKIQKEDKLEDTGSFEGSSQEADDDAL